MCYFIFFDVKVGEGDFVYGVFVIVVVGLFWCVVYFEGVVLYEDYFWGYSVGLGGGGVLEEEVE